MVHKSKVVAAILLLMLALFTFFTNAHAMGKDKTKSENKVTESGFPEKGIKNLAKAIESDNLGLRKSAVYYAGIYEISELVEPLKSQLRAEKNADLRILIALALYRIGNNEAIEAVQDLTVNDENQKVRKLAKSILNEFTDVMSARNE